MVFGILFHVVADVLQTHIDIFEDGLVLCHVVSEMCWSVEITFDQPKQLVLMHGLYDGFGVDTMSVIVKGTLGLGTVLIKPRFEMRVVLFEGLPLTLSHPSTATIFCPSRFSFLLNLCWM